MKSKRGGKRLGAGRKSQDGAVGMKRKNVMLDDYTVTKAKKIGSGSLSVGIRKAVKVHP